MGSLWAFLRKPSNRLVLGWLGGGVVIVVAGIWAVVTYVWPPHEAPTAVCANQGIVIDGSVSSRSSVTNRVTGGTTTAGPCVTETKK
jgi:hypothetical protein